MVFFAIYVHLTHTHTQTHKCLHRYRLRLNLLDRNPAGNTCHVSGVSSVCVCVCILCVCVCVYTVCVWCTVCGVWCTVCLCVWCTVCLCVCGVLYVVYNVFLCVNVVYSLAHLGINPSKMFQ